MPKNRDSYRPKRGYTWLGYLWIGAISLFIAVGIVINGQYGWGGEGNSVATQTSIITATGEPIRFWGAIGVLGAVFALMIGLWIKEEAYYRRLVACFEEEQEADK